MTQPMKQMQSSYTRMIRDTASLAEWRTWLTQVLTLLGSVVLPIAALFTFPIFIAEKRYGIIALDVVVWLLFCMPLVVKVPVRLHAFLWLVLVNGVTIVYYVMLGPHYARSAWLVSGAITAAIFFGTRAALVSTLGNAGMLMILYWLIDPSNPAWSATLSGPWTTWAMFVVNVSVVTLMSSLPVGFLLDRLDQALDRERSAHHALEVESSQSQGMMDRLPGMFYVCDQGRLVRWNRRLEEVLGYSAEELKNIHAPDLFAAEDRERVARAAERASIEGHAEEEVLLVTKEGGKIAHYWVGSRVMIDDRPHLVGMAIDITDRLQAEASVRESEARYRSLVENAPLGIIACDLTGKINSVNRTLLEILGSPSAAATSEINVLTFPPLVEAGITDQFRRCIEQGQDSVSEHYYQTKWGRTLYMRLYLTPIRDAVGAITGAQGIVEDTTERVEADQALRESEERLQLSLQAADVGLWDLNMRTNEVVVNPQWVEMLGYALGELDPHIATWQELTHPEDLVGVREAVNAHVRHQTPFYTIEYRLRAKSGQWEWVSARGKVVEWGKDGQPLRMAGTHLLISESKRAEQELRQYRDHLEELVQERTTELRRVVNLMAGREVRMAELKETIRQLRTQLHNAGLVSATDDPQGVQGGVEQ